jgi:hypothetical protein
MIGTNSLAVATVGVFDDHAARLSKNARSETQR